MVQNLAKWTPVFWGSGLGLFLSRTAAEAQPSPWPWPLLLAFNVASAALGIGLAGWAKNRVQMAPLGLLWIYVLWPRVDPTVASGVAFLAIFSLLLLHLKRFPEFWLDAGIFFLALGLYIHTLAPTILPADSGEFQFVSYILGIVHPPGYPLYTLLGKAFTFLPLGDVAYRVNLLSAVAAAGTLVLLSRTLRLVTGSAIAGGLAVLALGGSTTFWAQATTANIRMLTAFFAALIIFAAVSYAHEKKERQLIILAASLGLGITHHLSLILLIPPVLVYILLADRELMRRGQWLIKAGLAFLASLVFLLYIPIRAWSDAPFGGEGLRRLPGVLRHILGLGFQGDLFFFAQPEFLPERLQILANILDFQFGLPLLLAMVASGFVLAKNNPWLFLLWGGTFLLVGFTGITYRAPQTVEYLLPSYIPLVLALGYGGWWLSGRLSRYSTLRATSLSALFLLGFWQAAAHYPSYRASSQNLYAREYASKIMEQAPEGAAVLANWHWANPLWYLQYVEGARPDLEVQYVFPQGEEPIVDTWQRRLQNNMEQGPSVATNYYPNFLALPYRFYPIGDAFLVQKEPSFEIPTGFIPVEQDLGDRIRILGYRLEEVSPGRPLILDLFWQPIGPWDKDYSFFVHMVGNDGLVLGQMDLTHPASRNYQPGEVLADRYYISVLPTVPAGSYRLLTGVYFTLPEGGWQRLTTAEEKDTVALQDIDWVPAQELITLHPLHQPFAGGLVLSGVDYDLTLPGLRRIYLHWDKPAALSADFAYSLSWNGQVIAWGAIPQSTGNLLTLIGAPQEAWPLTLQVFSGENASVPLAALGPWSLPLWPSIELPVSGRDRYIDLGGEMLVVDVGLPNQPLVPGQEFFVDLKLIALRPITSDFSFSVRLADAQGRWPTTAVENSPTIGAVPTLKWIQGSVIYNRHTLQIPDDALPGTAQLSLVVYDAFTLRTVAILDASIAQLGTSLPLGQVQIAPP